MKRTAKVRPCRNHGGHEGKNETKPCGSSAVHQPIAIGRRQPGRRPSRWYEWRADWRVLAAVGMTLLGGCSEDDSSTGYRLVFVSETEEVDYVEVRWFAPAGEVFDGPLRVPETGRSAEGAEIGSLLIRQTSEQRPEERRLLAKGYVMPDVLVGEVAMRLPAVMPGEVTTLTVSVAAGVLVDTDEDGVPDRIDVCPTEPNPRQVPSCLPGDADGGTGADAGVGFDASVDAHAGDESPRTDAGSRGVEAGVMAP